MPIVQAIFIFSPTNKNANNNNIVNEHQNRWVIMTRGICVQKQCLEEKWNEVKWWAATAVINEWTNDNMSNNYKSINCQFNTMSDIEWYQFMFT